MSDNDRGPLGAGPQAYKWLISIGSALVGLLAFQIYNTINRTDQRLDELQATVSRDAARIETLEKGLAEHRAAMDKIDDRRRDDSQKVADHFETIESRIFDILMGRTTPPPRNK